MRGARKVKHPRPLKMSTVKGVFAKSRTNLNIAKIPKKDKVYKEYVIDTICKCHPDVIGRPSNK